MTATLLINLALIIGFSIYVIEKITKHETDRYREFVKSVLSSDLSSYMETLPEPGDTKKEQDNIMEDLSTVDEKILIKKLKEEYEDF